MVHLCEKFCNMWERRLESRPSQQGQPGHSEARRAFHPTLPHTAARQSPYLVSDSVQTPRVPAQLLFGLGLRIPFCKMACPRHRLWSQAFRVHPNQAIWGQLWPLCVSTLPSKQKQYNIFLVQRSKTNLPKGLGGWMGRYLRGCEAGQHCC